MMYTLSGAVHQGSMSSSVKALRLISGQNLLIIVTMTGTNILSCDDRWVRVAPVVQSQDAIEVLFDEVTIATHCVQSKFFTTVLWSSSGVNHLWDLSRCRHICTGSCFLPMISSLLQVLQGNTGGEGLQVVDITVNL